MVGPAVACAGQEVSGQCGLGDEVVELPDLLPQVLPPRVAALVEDGGRRVERYAEPLHDLDQDQPAQLLGVVHALAAVPGDRLDQAPLLVVPQRRGVHPEGPGRLANTDEGHEGIVAEACDRRRVDFKSA
jgi:hypothetical protein